ncbi:MAG: phospholipase D-like domain-containing protein [bacterium]
MFNQTQAFKEYLRRREVSINSEKPQARQNNNLFNEKNFYRSFINDMLSAKKEVIIYSPFVSKFRTDFLKSTINKLRHRNIEVFIFTRPINEYESLFQPQIECALKHYEEQGVNIFYLKGSIHEKLAIIDREILWEGSLNILSQRASREMMRRNESENSAMQVIHYLGLDKNLVEGYKLKYEKLYRSLMANSRQNLRIKMYIFLIGLAIPILTCLTIYLRGMILSGRFEFVTIMVRLFANK